MEHSIVAADGVDRLKRLDGESMVGTVVDGKLRSVGGVAGCQQQGGKQEKPPFHKNHLFPQHSVGFDFLPCKCGKRWFSYRFSENYFFFFCRLSASLIMSDSDRFAKSVKWMPAFSSIQNSVFMLSGS